MIQGNITNVYSLRSMDRYSSDFSSVNTPAPQQVTAANVESLLREYNLPEIDLSGLGIETVDLSSIELNSIIGTMQSMSPKELNNTSEEVIKRAVVKARIKQMMEKMTGHDTGLNGTVDRFIRSRQLRDSLIFEDDAPVVRPQPTEMPQFCHNDDMSDFSVTYVESAGSAAAERVAAHYDAPVADNLDTAKVQAEINTRAVVQAQANAKADNVANMIATDNSQSVRAYADKVSDLAIEQSC